MNEHDFGPDHHPRLDSARIRDTTPRELGLRPVIKANDRLLIEGACYYHILF
ncbi:hypothetical protein GLU26_00575 [Nanohaloarchaea archaeon]|nr:hypothetical protein [Candidatus Nanohaloarchaea archaeon]